VRPARGRHRSPFQFTKTPEVLRGMGAGELGKSESARRELRDKGLGG